MALSFFLILLPGLPVKNSLPVEQTHSANIISFSIYENENEPRLDDFLPLFVCFGTKIFSQHQISTTLLGLVRENRATPVLTRSLVRSPTSTPKPRAEGSSPSAPATKPAKTLGFRRFSFFMCCMVLVFTLVRTLVFLIWFYPFSIVPIPSSTQNAPGFALFGRFRVRFSLFCCFLAAKFLPWFLCTLLHSIYKLKPSVMPCRREVSFLT